MPRQALKAFNGGIDFFRHSRENGNPDLPGTGFPLAQE
jgi:hypothetical protein